MKEKIISILMILTWSGMFTLLMVKIFDSAEIHPVTDEVNSIDEFTFVTPKDWATDGVIAPSKRKILDRIYEQGKQKETK